MKTNLLAAFMVVTVLAACGGGSGSNSSTGSGPNWVGWTGNANGTVVIDGVGNQYQFDSANGCMYGVTTVSGDGPQGFCLNISTSSATGYASYGATNCLNPGTNSNCDTATFDVLLTNNPSGSGCIAVLGNGSATVTTNINPLDVEQNSAGGNDYFQITVDHTGANAYVTSNGYIVACSSASAYAGIYLFEPMGTDEPGIADNTLLRIDANGQVTDNMGDVTGKLYAGGAGSFSMATDHAVYSITRVSRNFDDQWVLEGVGNGGTFKLIQE